MAYKYSYYKNMRVRDISGKKIRRWSNVVLALMLVSLCVITVSATGVYSVFASGKNDVHYSGRETHNEVAIMINVYWGEEYLDDMLHTLEKYNATATFFIGGCWADKNNDYVGKIANAGHEIGNHGYFHKDGDKLDYAGNVREIRSLNALIEAMTGKKPVLFAPPSGAFGKETLQACNDENMEVIMWSKDTIDWRDKDKDLVVKRATDGVKAGDMILMHPTQHTAAALPVILEKYAAMGLKCVSVSTIIAPEPI